MRLSNSAQVRVLPSQTTARLPGQSLAWRATRTGMETNSGKSSRVGWGTRSESGLMRGPAPFGLLPGLDLLDRTAGLLPRRIAAFEMGDGRQAHVLRGLGGEGGAPGAGAEEHELVAGLEIILGVGTLRIDPHLQ